MRVKVEEVCDVSVTLLQAASQLWERVLLIEEATVAPDYEHYVSIPIHIFFHQSFCLRTGEILGKLHSVTLITDPTPLVEEKVLV